jgi:hypothetical protein
MSCRQAAQVVHSMELIGPEPGANFLFDDPRKVSAPGMGVVRGCVCLGGWAGGRPCPLKPSSF